MKLKKIIAAFLTAAVTLCLMPLEAFAASKTSAAGTDNVNVSAARVWNGKADTKWYTGKKDSYDIYTAEELAGFAQLVDKAAHEDRFRGITINLMNDIVLNDTSNWQEWSKSNPPKNEWNPIGRVGGPIYGYCPFAGTFNGNGHTVSGMFYSAKEKDPDPAGLFSYTSGAVISGLKVEKSVIDVGEKKAGKEFNSPSGILVGECEHTVFESCMSKDCIIRVSSCATFVPHHVGGLVGCDVKVNATAAVAIPLMMMTNIDLVWDFIPLIAGESAKVEYSYFTACAAENVTIDVCGLSFINTTEVGGLIGCGDDGIFLYNCYTKDISVSKREGFKPTSKPKQAGAVVGRGKGEIKKCYTCNFKRTDGYTGDRYDKKTVSSVKSDKLMSKDFVKKLGKGFEYKSGSAPKIKAINDPAVKIVLNGSKAKFSWNKVSGAKSYEVYFKGSNGKYSPLTTTEKTSVSLDNIKKGSSYDMMVKAVMSDGSYKDIGGKFKLTA